jgi:hypothetical protein
MRCYDVARYKTRYKRNQKRFAKVNHDPEQDLKLLKIFRPQKVIHSLWKNTVFKTTLKNSHFTACLFDRQNGH